MIFGGALFRAAGPILLDHIRGQIKHRAMEKSVNDAVFLLSSEESDAGAKGIARLVAAKHVESLYRSTDEH
jgi:hypothetical protein